MCHLSYVFTFLRLLSLTVVGQKLLVLKELHVLSRRLVEIYSESTEAFLTLKLSYVWDKPALLWKTSFWSTKQILFLLLLPLSLSTVVVVLVLVVLALLFWGWTLVLLKTGPVASSSIPWTQDSSYPPQIQSQRYWTLFLLWVSISSSLTWKSCW